MQVSSYPQFPNFHLQVTKKDKTGCINLYKGPDNVIQFRAPLDIDKCPLILNSFLLFS